jgi:hypothetical protein
MKLAAIYNLWDGEEFLRASMKTVNADVYLIVYQTISNFGEYHDPVPNIDLNGFNAVMVKYTPHRFGGFRNEIAKRNLGLETARELGCTHFLHLDTDELYKNFDEARNLYVASGKEGSAVKIFTYFKLPTFRFETEDGYYVPFIHKLHTHTLAGNNDYPFYCDPTRKINCSDVELLPVHMHHFSWVRRDINRKARNSSAKSNIERGTMLQSYNDPCVGPGYYVKDYDKKLIEVEDFFNLNGLFAG